MTSKNQLFVLLSIVKADVKEVINVDGLTSARIATINPSAAVNRTTRQKNPGLEVLSRLVVLLMIGGLIVVILIVGELTLKEGALQLKATTVT